MLSAVNAGYEATRCDGSSMSQAVVLSSYAEEIQAYPGSDAVQLEEENRALRGDFSFRSCTM